MDCHHLDFTFNSSGKQKTCCCFKATQQTAPQKKRLRFLEQERRGQKFQGLWKKLGVRLKEWKRQIWDEWLENQGVIWEKTFCLYYPLKNVHIMPWKCSIWLALRVQEGWPLPDRPFYLQWQCEFFTYSKYLFWANSSFSILLNYSTRLLLLSDICSKTGQIWPQYKNIAP